MSVYVLLLAVLFEGQTHIFHFGNNHNAVEFRTKEACEKMLREQEKEVPKLLAASPGATLQAIRCVERPAKGGV